MVQACIQLQHGGQCARGVLRGRGALFFGSVRVTPRVRLDSSLETISLYHLCNKILCNNTTITPIRPYIEKVTEVARGAVDEQLY